jgi:diguanylate cyclase (GGDEF)-like protein
MRAGKKIPNGPQDDKLLWRGSLLGKVTSFLLVAVALAYASGAVTGWLMLESSQREEWRRQAETNAQIASSAIRSIYTFVTVDLAPSGQIVRILSFRLIGDDQSVLDTGFIPADILALASVQTRRPVWLFQFDRASDRFIAINDGNAATGEVTLADPRRVNNAHPAPGDIFTGFVEIEGQSHYISFLPIETPDGILLGAVAASIGTADELLSLRAIFYRNSLLIFALIMLATGAAIVLVMHRLFHPVPALIDALKRIARDETGNITPYRRRKDEIGQLAIAIETLREAVVEREHLRQVRETAAQMEHMAHHDALTGLPNRTYLQKSLVRTLSDCASDDSAINVILFDLDRFKPVNDTYGHAVGDQVLIITSERVRGLIGPDDLLARLGGDEFALIQKVKLNARHQAQKLAGRILQAIAQPYRIGDLILQVGASIGIASAPEHGDNPAVLFNNADLALYASKAAGRGTFSLFCAGMTMPGSGRTSLEEELIEALATDQMEVHYQPIVQVTDGRLTGYEALVRWRHPQRGLVPPGVFIPVAEESGLIVDLGRWVMTRACREAAAWPNGLTVSVNISAREINQDDLPKRIREVLGASGLEPHRLEIELTESVLLDQAAALPAMQAIRAMGVGIAVDDFGTGYATLSYLADLPFTRIKLDRRFISAIETRRDCRSIVTSTIALARELNMSTTAEGVETAGQLQLLQVLGCQSAQGYYFGKPELLPRPSILKPVAALTAAC